MGTWRWFSIKHCETTSSCVVVDAWLQLVLCVAASLFVLLLAFGCCFTCCRRGPTTNEPYSQRFWSAASLSTASTTSFSGSRVPVFAWLFGGAASSTSSRSKTAPMPLAVIQKDADEAHITSHKNSLKQASEFMRQTQRISKTDFATQPGGRASPDPRRPSGGHLSFLERIGGSFSRRNSKPLDADGERRRASHDASPRSDKIPIRKRSNPLPSRSSTSRRGSVNTSSLELESVLSAAAGMHYHRKRAGTDDDDDANDDDDQTRRPSKTQSGGGRLERTSSLRKRLTNVLTPHFLRGLHRPSTDATAAATTAESPSSSSPSKKKTKPLRERSHTTFDEPSYRKRQKLAALPLEHRKNKERRGSVELRDKRRLSVGKEAQIQFEVSDGSEASVYEVKLKEITLVKRLAFGPLSEVYAAIWRDTKVGVKLLMPREGVTDKLEEAVKNFRREIWVMGALKHPNITKLIGASLTPTCYVLVMEYMSNGSLYEYLRDEANFFPHQMVLTSALDVADGMRHIHACGVLQRDLKSKNCLVSENLVVKVADFGLSRFAAKGEQYTFVGTPFWAAPEVIRHEPYDEKADVYSYAIVLWELVERKDPYEDINAFQVPLQVANDGLRPADFSRPAPLGLEQLMKQCWDANPDQRPSFDEIAETLQKWLTPSANGAGGSDGRTDDSDSAVDDLSAHVQRERHCANESQLNRFASSHDANAKAIPIVLSRGKTDRAIYSLLLQRRSSAITMAAMLPRAQSDRSLSRVSNHSAP